MKGVLLRLEADPGLPLDLEPLSQAIAEAPGLEALRRLRLWQGRRRVSLGDLFQVATTKRPVDLELCQAKGFLHGLGTGLATGRFLVRGEVGDYFGRGMQGGELILHGTAGDRAGLGMRGGLLRIQGSCGDALGGAAPGQRVGMRGGTILLSGSCGERAGEFMRRGLIVIRGNCGDYCATGMHAGTVIVQGTSGLWPGNRMRRGTLFLAQPPKAKPTGFAPCALLEIGYLRLLRRHLDTLQRGLGKTLIPEVPLVRCYLGDLGVSGKGEIFIPATSADTWSMR